MFDTLRTKFEVRRLAYRLFTDRILIAYWLLTDCLPITYGLLTDYWPITDRLLTDCLPAFCWDSNLRPLHVRPGHTQLSHTVRMRCTGTIAYLNADLIMAHEHACVCILHISPVFARILRKCCMSTGGGNGVTMTAYAARVAWAALPLISQDTEGGSLHCWHKESRRDGKSYRTNVWNACKWQQSRALLVKNQGEKYALGDCYAENWI